MSSGGQIAWAHGRTIREAGNAYAFNAKNGHLVYTFTSPNAQFLGYFGYSVAATAKIVVVGAMGETASGYSMAGHAYVF